MLRLSRQTTPSGALLGASAGDATGMVHLGLGNFHRAHAAVYTAQALAAEPGEWGIHGFANRSHDVVDAMRAQDGRYSVLELSERGRRAAVVDVHRGLGVLADEPDAFVAAIAAPANRILTLTVSEVGYCRSPRNGRLDVDRDDVRADLADPANPRSTIGLSRPRPGRPRRERRPDDRAVVRQPAVQRTRHPRRRHRVPARELRCRRTC